MLSRHKILPLTFAFAVVLSAALSGCGWAEWPPREGSPSVAGEPLAQASPSTPQQVQRAPIPDAAAIVPPSRKPNGDVPTTPRPVSEARADFDVQAQPGDTVYALSRQYGVPTRAIIETNALKPPFELFVGQTLTIPARSGHQVIRGETLYSIARAHGLETSSLAAANGLIAPYRITTGQWLKLPHPEGTATPTPKPKPPPPVVASASPAVANSGPLASPPPRSAKTFGWPVDGRVVSSFGPKKQGLRNDGINIAAPRGTPVRAAENGVVAYAGNELRGFGNLVLLRHADGWVTAYAHNDELLVKRGDVVRRGQVIAKVGSSGAVNSAQLHFQVRKGKDAIDPRKHLAAKSG